MEKRLITVTEAAGVLSLSRSTLYTLMKSGQISSVKIGGCRRFTEENINSYLAGLE